MTLQSLVPRFNRSQLAWEAALRATLATAAPLLVLLAIGRVDLGIYASFAAFTALYGRSEPYRRRAAILAIVGCTLFACIAAGTAAQTIASPLWLLGAGFVVVIVVGVVLSSIMQLVPRGAIFFTFAFLGSASKPIGDTPLAEAVLTAAIVAVFAWLVAMSGAVLRLIPAVRRRLRPLRGRPQWHIRDAFTRENLVLIVVTVLLGAGVYLAASSVDLASHHYWAVVTVVAICSSFPALVSFDRLSHRVVGTMIGVGLAAALYGGAPHPLYVIAIVAVCTFVTELIIGQHYGWALSTITPLAIGATNLGLTTEWEVLFVDRARETLLGGAACLAVILAFRWWFRRRGNELPA
ncbi:MAG: FUSC family protein [Pseudoclavibacter sp.]